MLARLDEVTVDEQLVSVELRRVRIGEVIALRVVNHLRVITLVLQVLRQNVSPIVLNTLCVSLPSIFV